jgi:hypothetical protein
MPEKIEINNKKYLKRTLELISGVKNFYDVEDNLLLIAEAVDNPYDFAFLLEDIYDMDFDEDLRLALVRIQIDSKLHMRDDLEREQLRLYVAETIEKMLFGELLMEGDGKGRERDEDKDKKKDKKDKKKKNKKKSESKSKSKRSGKSRGRKGKGKGKKSDSSDEKESWEDIYI